MRHIKKFDSYKVTEGFGWGSLAGGLAATSRSLSRSGSSAMDYEKRTRHNYDSKTNPNEISVHNVTQYFFGKDLSEVTDTNLKQKAWRIHKEINNPASTIELEELPRDIDQALSIIGNGSEVDTDKGETVHSISMKEFGREFTNLTDHEKRIVLDKYGRM